MVKSRAAIAANERETTLPEMDEISEVRRLRAVTVDGHVHGALP